MPKLVTVCDSSQGRIRASHQSNLDIIAQCFLYSISELKLSHWAFKSLQPTSYLMIWSQWQMKQIHLIFWYSNIFWILRNKNELNWNLWRKTCQQLKVVVFINVLYSWMWVHVVFYCDKWLELYLIMAMDNWLPYFELFSFLLPTLSRISFNLVNIVYLS